MFARLELLQLFRVTSFTDFAYDHADSKSVIVLIVVRAMAVDTGDPRQSHSAFVPGRDDFRIDFQVAIYTDLIVDDRLDHAWSERDEANPQDQADQPDCFHHFHVRLHRAGTRGSGSLG